MDGGRGFAGPVQAEVDGFVGGGAQHLHLAGGLVSVLGLHHRLGTQAQAVALPGDGELDGGGAVSG